jgi:hypothetical protein
VGSGIFKSGNPAARAEAIVKATTFHDDPDVIAKVSRGLGEAMVGINVEELPEPLAYALECNLCFITAIECDSHVCTLWSSFSNRPGRLGHRAEFGRGHRPSSGAGEPPFLGLIAHLRLQHQPGCV